MKARLLTLAALGWAASAMAGDWAKPTISSDAKVDPQDKDTVYVFNEATGQFLTGANDWGTQASVMDNGIAWALVYEATAAVDDNDEPIYAWGLKNLRPDKKNLYLFYDGGGSSFIDMGSQNGTYPDCNYWNLEKQADGTYTIQIVETCSLWEEGKYFAWAGNEDGRVMPGFDIEAAETNGDPYGMYWSFVTPAAYEAYAAKIALYNKLNEAEEEGVSTAEAEAVYNNPAATVEECEAAVQALDVAIIKGKTEGSFKDASPENPVDATFLIKNPSFDENTSGSDVPGWDCTFNGWQQSRVDGPAGGIQIIGPFVEQWVNHGSKLDDRYCKQQLSLPAGVYTLSAHITARQQGNSSTEVTGANLFATVGDGEKAIVSCSSQEVGDVPLKYNLTFYVAQDGTPVVIGFETVSTTANWIAFDNFSLLYMGNAGSAEFINMNLALSEIKPYTEDVQDDDDWYNMSVATIAELDAIIAEAEALNNATPAEELLAMTTRLAEMLEKVKAERAAYQNLRTLRDKVYDSSEKLGDVDVVGDKLGSLVDDIRDHLENGDLDAAGIEALEAEYDNIIKVELPAHIEDGMDLTMLLVNPNFDNDSRDGWIAPQGWTNVAAGCAEMWNKDFDVYQEITNLPVGKYEVGLNGFYRQGGWAAAADLRNSGQENITAYVYGESGGIRAKTPFASIFEGMLEEGEQYTDGSDVVHNSDVLVNIDGVDGYIPDGMAGFAHHVNNYGQYQFTVELFVLDGTLKLGAMNERHNEADWVIFDNFTLKFITSDLGEIVKKAAQEELDRLIEKRDALLENQPLPQDVCDMLDKLAVELDAAEKNEEVKAVADKIAEVEKELDAVVEEATQMFNLYNHIDGLLTSDLVTSSDPEGFAEYMQGMYDKFTPGETPWETIEAMRADAEMMRTGWNKYVTADVDGATQAEPVDVSHVILNRGFYDEFSKVDNSNEFWTIEQDNTTDDGANAANNSEQEFYNNDSFDISQTLNGLPAGYYELQVQGFYRPGWPLVALQNDTTYANHADLYASVGETTWASKLMNIYEGAALESVIDGEITALKANLDENGEPVLNDEGEADSITIYFPNSMTVAQEYFISCPDDQEYDDENPNKYGYYRGNKVVFEVKAGEAAKVGIRKDNHVTGDWCIFDDFQLFYLGTQPADGVQGVSAGRAVSQKYYTIGGVQLARPQKGVNIVTTTLSDGSKVTTKVLVK